MHDYGSADLCHRVERVGKVVDTDRCREKTVSRKGEVIDLWYAGKTHDFGGNIQALFYPCGDSAVGF